MAEVATGEVSMTDHGRDRDSGGFGLAGFAERKRPCETVEAPPSTVAVRHPWALAAVDEDEFE